MKYCHVILLVVPVWMYDIHTQHDTRAMLYCYGQHIYWQWKPIGSCFISSGLEYFKWTDMSVPYIRILVKLCLATFHSITKYTIQTAFDVRWFIWKLVCAYHILNVTISSTLPLTLANSFIPFNRLVNLYSQNILTIHVCGWNQWNSMMLLA